MAQLGKQVKGSKKGKDGKKDGKDQGAAQTSAEKALEDRIRRLRINDYKKRLAQASKARLQKRLKQESENSRVNMIKIQNQWRKIMRLAKVESLQKDVEVISQNHERDVDRSDAIVQMLDRDLEEAEEQYQMGMRSHLQNVDALISLQDSRLLTLEREFEKDLATLAEEFNAEKRDIKRRHLLSKTELVDIMGAVESEEKERDAEEKQEFEQTREEIRNKNLEDLNVLKITLESQIEELEKHFESAHLNYLQNTDQRTQDFKYLTRKDEELSKEIEIKIRKIERLQSSLTHWRTKIDQNVKECEERNSALREEKDQISSHFQKLKRRMNRFRDGQKKRLLELTKAARNSKGTLKNNLGLAERILKLAELARKLETEQEKILPFYESSADEEKTSSEDGYPQKSSTSAEAKTSDRQVLKSAGDESLDEWEYLNRFYRKYNKALLDKIAIEKEKEQLENSNAELQSILKQYLDGISVNPSVMESRNPLLVVNGRVEFQRRVGPGETRKPPVVEGNHMANTRRTTG